MDPSAISVNSNYIKPIPCKNKEVYNELNTLIYEYLEVNGLEQALRTFSKECHIKNLPCPQLAQESGKDAKAAFTHYDGEQLLKSFDEGDFDSFLMLWKQFQSHIQVTSEDMTKLEVYLRVHFAIFPKARGFPEADQTKAMQQLKTFFEEHSESLSSDTTVLPLFALPFVSDPRPHPIFKDLFQDAWTVKLRSQLETTVNKYFELLQENITTHCKLASVVVKSKTRLYQNQATSFNSYCGSEKFSSEKGNSTTSIKSGKKISQTSVTSSRSGKSSATKLTESSVYYHQDRFFQLLGIHKKLRKVLRGVRENYAKLLKVCSILITSLENSEDPASVERIISQCYIIYPEIFTNHSTSSTCSVLSNSSNKPDLGHFKKLVAAASATQFNTEASDVSLLFLGLMDIGVDSLNYAKIKTDLCSERITPTEKLCLLQALRWLITKTSPTLRTQVMLFFTENDVLALGSEFTDIRHKLFSPLLSLTPTYQKESLSRLVNAIASTWAGRSYLTSSDYVLDVLVQSLNTFKTQEESFICHMVIATLQKLSLRKNMRELMIKKNVIPWLVRYIKTELDRDLVRDEVGQVLLEESGTINTSGSNNTDVSYGDTTFNNYLMEYLWALLMNLSLHPESIKSALTVDFEFLHCIVTMLTSKFTSSSSALEFIPYVLSTLFSLLRNPEMFEKAKTMRLDEKLGPVIENQPSEIASHMKHLLTQLYEKNDVDRLMALGETEYDDTDNPDPDELEMELELQESWMTSKNESNMLVGDDLLIKEYMVKRDITSTSNNVPLDSTFPNGTNNPSKTALNSVDHLIDSSDTGIVLRPTTPTRGKTLRTTVLNDSYQQTDRRGIVTPPILLNQHQQTSLVKASVGVETTNMPTTPQIPFARNLPKLEMCHLLHPTGEQIIKPIVQLVTIVDEEQERKGLSQLSATSLPPSPLPLQMMKAPKLAPILMESPLQEDSNQNQIPTTIRIVENIVNLKKADEIGQVNYKLHESPMIAFSDDDNNITSSPSERPTQHSPHSNVEKRSIVISYVGYEDNACNNNPLDDKSGNDGTQQ